MKETLEYLYSYPMWVKLALVVMAIIAGVLLLFFQPKKTGEIAPSIVLPQLSEREVTALGLTLTDTRAGDRGAWAYPLHQNLTYRGFSDAEATAVLNSLVAKKVLVYVEVDTDDSLTGKSSKAPAYRVTESGFAFAAQSNELRKFNDTYYYTIQLKGSNSDKRNIAFLEQLRRLEIVQNQTRFIIDDKPNQSNIAVFAYQSLDVNLVRNMADAFNVSIVNIAERK